MAAWVPWAFAEPPSTGGRYPAGRASKASNCEDGLNQTLTRCVAQCLPGRPYSPRVVTAPFSPTRALVHFAMPVRLYICIAPWRMTTRFLTAEAVEDFSVACQLMPEYGDAWKRRGQARSALGENEGALEVCFAVVALKSAPACCAFPAASVLLGAVEVLLCIARGYLRWHLEVCKRPWNAVPFLSCENL